MRATVALALLLAAALPAAAQQLGAPPPAAPPPLLARPPAPPPPRVVALADAERLARANYPALRQARANAAASRARADESRSGLLPQVAATAAYERSTSNFTPRPGATPSQFSSGAQNWTTYDYFNTGVTATQLVWDFGLTTGRWDAAKETAEADAQAAHFTEQQAVLNVRTAFFQARAGRALVRVARDTVANQTEHLKQTQAFVDIGTHPFIDLATARTNLANAQVQLVNAENGYDTARARLNQAMGVEAPIDYEVSDDTLPPVEGEDLTTDALLVEALRSRPDVASADRRIVSAERSVDAARGSYWPSLGVSTGVTDAGLRVDSLGWNWFAGATLTWNLFAGGLTQAQVQEARSNVEGTRAADDQTRQQVRFDIEQARLSVRAARTSLGATGDAVTNAHEQLRLAEGRYKTGAGNAVELSDAQVASTNAEAQRVQAEYNLATARAQLLQALGRDSR